MSDYDKRIDRGGGGGGGGAGGQDYNNGAGGTGSCRSTQDRTEYRIVTYPSLLDKTITSDLNDARGALANEGVKHDQNKEPLSLLSRTWLLGVSKVMGFGAKKYAAHNWRKGIARSRLMSAALRHLLAYMEGEDTDPETGLSHLDHASCCIMFMRETHETHPELDDRYKRDNTKK